MKHDDEHSLLELDESLGHLLLLLFRVLRVNTPRSDYGSDE